MKRLLPKRHVSGNNEINEFALIDAQINNKSTDSGLGDEGVLVQVAASDLTADVDYTNDAHLGKTDYPHVFNNLYPKNPRKIQAVPASATTGKGDVLGFTLKETADYDENGEKFLYNREKADRQDVALRGQSVPVLLSGVITLSQKGIVGNLVVGGGFKASLTEAGKVDPCTADDVNSLGTVIGTGVRSSKTGVFDKFEGHYAMILFRA